MSALPLGNALEGIRLLQAPARHREHALAPRTFIEVTPIPLLFTDRPRGALSAGLSQAWRPLGGDNAAAAGRAGATGLVGARLDQGRKLQFRLAPRGEATLLTCETRMVAVDARTRRVFGLYWFLIRAGSVAIRREVLSVVAGRAESHTRHGTDR